MRGNVNLRPGCPGALSLHRHILKISLDVLAHGFLDIAETGKVVSATVCTNQMTGNDSVLFAIMNNPWINFLQ